MAKRRRNPKIGWQAIALVVGGGYLAYRQGWLGGLGNPTGKPTNQAQCAAVGGQWRTNCGGPAREQPCNNWACYDYPGGPHYVLMA